MQCDRPEILSVRGLIRRFSPESTPALAGISLALEQGDLLALLGPSGCGKTTLLRAIAGFEVPEAGTIAIAGSPVAGEGCWIPPEKRNLGMVFQDYALFPHLTVAENTGFGLSRLRKHRPVEAKARTEEAIALVGLQGLEKRYPHELSGGQQQRVALARALAPDPALVLLDEPLSNLDAQVRQHLRQEIRRILKAAGASGIFVTHDREEAMAIADRLAVMRDGRLEQVDRPEVLYGQPASRFVAGFVTQCNFLPAGRSDRGWETEIGIFGGTVVRSGELGDRGVLAVRQTDLALHFSNGKVADEDGTQAVTALVLSRQFLGREYAYTLQLPSNRQLQVLTDTQTLIEPQTKVHLTFATETLQLFPGT